MSCFLNSICFWFLIIKYFSSIQCNEQEITYFSWFVGITSLRRLNWAIGLEAIFCGGSLITTKDVLTAKHCLEHFRPEDLRIITEYWLIPKWERENGTINENHFRIVKKISLKSIPMKYFGPYYDVAIITLEKSTTIFPVCLPKLTEFRGPAKGWAIVNIREFWLQSSLAQTAYYRDDCIYNIFENTETADKVIRELINVFCAGDPSGVRDTCTGDSGGPFVAKPKNYLHNGTYYVIYGVMSFGFGCHVPGNFAVYTDVRKYLDWIKYTVEAKDFC